MRKQRKHSELCEELGLSNRWQKELFEKRSHRFSVSRASRPFQIPAEGSNTH
jgi:hypothetical protein